MKLIKNIQLLSEKKGHLKDILIAGKKIVVIDENMDVGNLKVEKIDGKGAIATPGLIDIHVHTAGGGGQTGFYSLAPEVIMCDMIQCGTTSVVGTLGTDGFVKQLPQLYAKTMSLRMNGMSAYMLTGFYGLPTPVLTDCIANDLIFIDPVVGCKIAICDDRSSFPSCDDLMKIISQVRLGGFTSNKRGVMHVHLGALPEGMEQLLSIAKKYPTLIQYISPTHTIRTEHLFFQGIEFAKMGGMIDITTGASQYIPPYKGVLVALENGVSINNMTFSSDGNGGVKKIDPVTGEETYTIAPINSNLDQLKKLIFDGGLDPNEAFKLLTVNAAKTMALKGKGLLQAGYDAEICLFDE
jgi:beta-aspartyl-dipeptidase (metallo-type)